MKKTIIKVLSAVTFIFIITTAIYSQTYTANATIKNIKESQTQISFDISMKPTADIYSMGNTTFIVNFPIGMLTNPQLSYFSPRYLGPEYSPPKCIMIRSKKIAVQFYCKSFGVTVAKRDEVLFTVTCDKLIPGDISFTWDLLNTAIVTPSFLTVETNYLNNTTQNNK